MQTTDIISKFFIREYYTTLRNDYKSMLRFYASDCFMSIAINGKPALKFNGKDKVISLLEEFNLKEAVSNLDNGHVSVAPFEHGDMIILVSGQMLLSDAKERFFSQCFVLGKNSEAGNEFYEIRYDMLHLVDLPEMDQYVEVEEEVKDQDSDVSSPASSPSFAPIPEPAPLSVPASLSEVLPNPNPIPESSLGSVPNPPSESVSEPVAEPLAESPVESEPDKSVAAPAPESFIPSLTEAVEKAASLPAAEPEPVEPVEPVAPVESSAQPEASAAVETQQTAPLESEPAKNATEPEAETPTAAEMSATQSEAKPAEPAEPATSAATSTATSAATTTAGVSAAASVEKNTNEKAAETRPKTETKKKSPTPTAQSNQGNQGNYRPHGRYGHYDLGYGESANAEKNKEDEFVMVKPRFPNKKRSPAGSSLFVRYRDPSINREVLQQVFKSEGTVVNVSMIESRMFAFVDFLEEGAAKKALDKSQTKPFYVGKEKLALDLKRETGRNYARRHRNWRE